MVPMLMTLLGILVVNLILSADNAIVIAMATMRLQPRQRVWAMWFGTLASIILRVLITVVASVLLSYPYIQAAGGALLFYIAIKLLLHVDGSEDMRTSTTFWRAVVSILLADLTMSLDNVLAVAALAKGHIGLLIIGLCISIVCIVFASQWIMALMERNKWLTYLGASILGWTAGAMIAKDTGFHQLFPHAGWAPLLFLGVVAILGIMRQVGYRISH